MRDHGLIERLALGAAAGFAGTIAIQGLLMATQKWLPDFMPPIREDPGEFMVQKMAQALPPEMAAKVPTAAETAAAKSLAVGYGLTAGMLYTMLRPDADDVLSDGTALGLGTWASGYVGWLPALDLMPPLTEQRVAQTVGPVIHHFLFGVATVAVYRWLKRIV
jgi:hypothetical protein